ncbi:hypothetical protein D3C72_2192890 [compost metagenome]
MQIQCGSELARDDGLSGTEDLNLGTHLTAIDQHFQRITQTRRLVANQQMPDATFQLADTLTAQCFQITLR